MSSESKKVTGTKPQGKSRVGNGSALLPNIDGRSVLARRYKEILLALKSDMGSDPSEAKLIIARRASTLACWCEDAEAAMARGEDMDIAEFTTACNALRRLLTDIGLERTARDVTPSLDKYLADTYSGAAA